MPLVFSNVMTAFSDLASGGGLGAAVAVSADGKMVAMTSKSGVAAVYTSTRVAGVWTPANLLFSDANASDGFGAAVAVSSDGSVILVGVPGRTKTGAFISFINGMPSPYFFASDLTPSADFGSAVAISYDGKTAIIGAPTASGVISGQGAAYIFVRSDTVWSQQSKLLSSFLSVGAGDSVGQSVAISADGNTAVVGAPNADPYSQLNQGSVSIFTRSDTTWAPSWGIVASDGVAGDNFGTSVAISADASTILVGAPNATPTIYTSNEIIVNSPLSDNIINSFISDVTIIDSPTGQGKAYVFTSLDGTWPLQTTTPLTIDGNFPDVVFGQSVSLSCNGNIALVSATDYPDGAGPGAVFFFTRSGSAWSLSSPAIVELNGVAPDNFGSVVALSADGMIAVVGDPNQYNDQGSTYIYHCGYDIPNLPCFSCCGNSTPGARGSDGAPGPIGLPGIQGPIGPQGLAGANLTASAYLNQILLFALLLYGGFLLMFFTITFC